MAPCALIHYLDSDPSELNLYDRKRVCANTFKGYLTSEKTPFHTSMIDYEIIIRI